MKTINKFMIALAVVSFSVQALATSLPRPAQAPVIKCELLVMNGEQFGVSPVYSVEVNNLTPLKFNGFEFKAELKLICAEDGGPCSDSYNLTTVISQGEAESRTFYIVSEETEKNTRFASALNLGKNRAHVNCDIY